MRARLSCIVISNISIWSTMTPGQQFGQMMLHKFRAETEVCSPPQVEHHPRLRQDHGAGQGPHQGVRLPQRAPQAAGHHLLRDGQGCQAGVVQEKGWIIMSFSA